MSEAVSTDTTEPSVAIEPDPVLLDSRDVARAALAEISDEQTIGADEGFEAHDTHVLTLFFECRLPGYPGWRWAATLSRVDEESSVNVLEVELLPGEGSVVAPDWVPWSERLAHYREGQAKQAEEEAAAAETAAAELAAEDEAEDSLLDNDFSDFDDEIDGVNVDGDDDDDDDDDDETDEDGFAVVDEHDINDTDDFDDGIDGDSSDSDDEGTDDETSDDSVADDEAE